MTAALALSALTALCLYLLGRRAMRRNDRLTDAWDHNISDVFKREVDEP